ncbi:hypothetical protein N7456_012943 [Penicillium angulare]|uniref:Uncharacterized protein n=1 Tax=Penicillium angulare TaxID=116970 RepID=A0A9W9EKS0_9EURO|nr:hypothetical protein N7456_012943 [Penicillium angulare]
MEKENEKPVNKPVDYHWEDAVESHDDLRVDTKEKNDPPTSPTVSRLADLGLEAKSPTAQPGNAFALMKLPDADGNRLPPRKSTGSSESNSSSDGCQRPHMLRKMSSLDYNESLALPMPKPRHPKDISPDSPCSIEDEIAKYNEQKKRVVTDPVISVDITASESGSSHDAGDNKKVSRLDMIKSKLSFKDLRKESARQELATNPVPQGRRAFTGSAIPTPASTLPGSRVKEKTNPASGRKISSPILPSSATMTQIQHANRKIPLPPSGTFHHPPSTLIPSRRTSTIDKQAPATTSDLRTMQRKLDSTNDSTNVTEKGRRGGPPSRASIETPSGKPLPAKPSSGPRNTVTKDSSSSHVRYLTDGQAPVNPFDGLSAPRHLSGGKFKTPSPTAYSKSETPVSPMAEHLPSLMERLNKENMPHEKEIHPEVSAAAHLDDIVDLVRSIQRQLDTGMASVSRKIEDLSTWVGDQLKNQIESNSDLSRANSDLFSKQYQISREMMKFQLDIRLDIGAMERRMSLFENKVLDDLQNEIRSLARSYEELSQKTEMIIEKYSFGDAESFIDQQLQRNAEIERELAYLKARQQNFISHEIAPFAAEQRIPSRQSLSSRESSEPLIKQNMIVQSPRPPPETTNIMRNPARVMAMTENRTLSAFPRSVSLTKKGFLKGIKDMTSSPLEPPKEKPLSKTSSNDDTKRWNVFGLRRKREHTDATNKFTWSPRARRIRDPMIPEDTGTTCSRSSTPPIPFVPRSIPYPNEQIERSPTPFPTSTVHPALRESPEPCADESVTTSYETAPEAEQASKLVTSLEEKILEGSVDGLPKVNDSRSSSPIDRPDSTRNITPVSKERLSVQDDVSPGTTLHRASEENNKDQAILNDHEQDWDHVSVHETKYHV